MQIRNDYERGVFNGDTGWIAQVDPKGGELVVTLLQRQTARTCQWMRVIEHRVSFCFCQTTYIAPC